MLHDEYTQWSYEDEQYLEMISFLNESLDSFLFFLDFRTNKIHFGKELNERFAFKAQPKNGYSVEDFLSVIYPRDLSIVQEQLTKMRYGEKTVCAMECRFIDRDGGCVWVNCKGKSKLDKNGVPRFMCGRISSDVMLRTIDSLTGLKNAEKYTADMTECLKNGKAGYILLFGVDNLKNINIKHGRTRGNQILKQIAEELEELAGREGARRIYRLEGDRFAVNMVEAKKEDVENFYQKMRKNTALYCTLSAGAFFYDAKEIQNSEMIFQYAESALDHAKSEGKDMLMFFWKDEYDVRLGNINLQEEIRQSIKNQFDGFEIYYQPQIDFKTQEIIGAEALLRYYSASRGNVEITEVISILEQTEWICSVGKWVLEEALKQCQKWRKKKKDFHISVNVSYVQLRKNGFEQLVVELLKSVDIPGSALTLEVTESMRLQDYKYFNKVFYTWDKVGVKIAIDDFGTGYSSLSYLKSIAIDEIKIDRCFIRGIQHSVYNYRLLSNIVELAHSTMIRVCCEGVETEEEMRILRNLNPDIIQGFLYGKPCSKDLFERAFIYGEAQKVKVIPAEKESYHANEEQGQYEFLKMMEDERLAAIVEGMDELVYVSDVENYELLYMNAVGRERTGSYDYQGLKCYQVFHGRNTPCEFCTNKYLKADQYYVWEMENVLTDGHFILKDKLIPWKGKMARLELAVDVGEKEILTQRMQEKIDIENNIVECAKILEEEQNQQEALQGVLGVIGKFFDAYRVYILKSEQTTGEWSCFDEWIRGDLQLEEKQWQSLTFKKFPRKGEKIEENFGSLSEEVLTTPIMRQNKVIGILGVEKPKRKMIDCSQLKVMACLLMERGFL